MATIIITWPKHKELEGYREKGVEFLVLLGRSRVSQGRETEISD